MTRLAILTMLQDGEMCVCEIMEALPVSQPAVSHHLRILRQAGLIADRRQGKWIFYSLDPDTDRFCSISSGQDALPTNKAVKGCRRRSNQAASSLH